MAANRSRPNARDHAATFRSSTTLAVVAAVATACIGCSVEKHYKLLSLFFDGVPEPAAADGSAGGGDPLGGLASAGMVSAHTAYTDRRCADCHGPRSQFGLFTSGFTGLDDGLCVQCHVDVLMLPKLHGPVAAQACLWCHDPHESRHPALLVKGSPELCLGCHELQLQGAKPSRGHEPPQDCLGCHRSHGGSTQYFLHVNELPTQPADPMQPGPAEP